MKRQIFFFCVLGLFSTLSAQIDYKIQSQNFVLGKLKNPSTANFIGYLSPSESRALLNKALCNIKECTEVTRVTVDAQNGFGAYIRSDYFVFFANCLPCHMIDAKAIENQENFNRAMFVRLALATNFCDCEKSCLNNSKLNESKEQKEMPVEMPKLPEIKIGEQIWTTSNLDLDKFRNGDLIAQASGFDEWKKAGEQGKPMWCYYDFNEGNKRKYGKLYNYYAIADPRGLAPVGYHIPTANEWSQLVDYIGNTYKSAGIIPVGKLNAGRQMKVEGFGSDKIPERCCVNWSGFYGTPGGRMGFGRFENIEHQGTWWSSTEIETGHGFTAVQSLSLKDGDDNSVQEMWTFKNWGHSVRLVKGEQPIVKNKLLLPPDNEEVKIGNQIWMTKNLNVTSFLNGDPIQEVKTFAEWDTAAFYKKPAFIQFTLEPDKYGKLYNWYAVIDKRGLAPKGWHIPSVEEWRELADNLGGSAVAGSKLRVNSGAWKDVIIDSLENLSGFYAYPAGYQPMKGYPTQSIGAFAAWWSISELNPEGMDNSELYKWGWHGSGELPKAWRSAVNNNSKELFITSQLKGHGASIRCIKGDKKIALKDYSKYPKEYSLLLLAYRRSDYLDLLYLWGTYALNWSQNAKDGNPQKLWTSEMLDEMKNALKDKLINKELKKSNFWSSEYKKEFKKAVFQEVDNPFYIEGFSK